MKFRDNVEHCGFKRICSIIYTVFRYVHVHAVKFAVKLQSRRKKAVLGPDFYGEGIPLISDIHFHIVLTSKHACGWFSLSLFSEFVGLLAKKKTKDRRLSEVFFCIITV